MDIQLVLALNGFVCPEPSHVTDDPRSRPLLHTAKTADTLTDCNINPEQIACFSSYPRKHDDTRSATRVPVSDVEYPATNFPRSAEDDYPEWYIDQAPWTDLENTIRLFAESPSPKETRTLSDPEQKDPKRLGNAVDFAVWMMEKALEVKAHEKTNQEPHELANLVFCNWDLDSDRGYAYKQWFTTMKPSTSTSPLDEKYLGEDLIRS